MRAFAALVLLALPLAASAKTFEWDEDVTLASGATIRVARAESRGDLPAGLPGGQSMRSQSLSFDHAGKRVKWSVDTGSWPMYVKPRALEIVNGEPMLLFAVWASEGCSRFDFPQDAIGALRYRGGAWQVMPRSEIPAGVKVNLLHEGAYALPRYPQYKGLVIDARLRGEMEKYSQVPGPGATLEALSKHYAGLDNPMYGNTACRILRRAPDPALDSAARRIAEAQRSPVVSALAGEIDETRREIPSWTQQGMRWTDRAWVTSDCKGIVEKTEMLATLTTKGASTTISANGNAIVLIDKGLNGGRVEITDGRLSLQRVSCEAGGINVFARRDASNVVLIRLRRNGELRDVTNIFLPEADKLADKGWAPVWDIEIGDDSLRLAIGAFLDYSGSRSSTLLRSRSYSVKLPS